MKFSVLSLSLLASSVNGQNEIELIEKRKAPRIQHGHVATGMCNNKPLNANMLMTRVRTFKMPPKSSSHIVIFS